MKNYNVYIPWSFTFKVLVQAQNEQEAIEKASKQRPSVCSECSDDIEINDWDDLGKVEVIQC